MFNNKKIWCFFVFFFISWKIMVLEIQGFRPTATICRCYMTVQLAPGNSDIYNNIFQWYCIPWYNKRFIWKTKIYVDCQNWTVTEEMGDINKPHVKMFLCNEPTWLVAILKWSLCKAGSLCIIQSHCTTAKFLIRLLTIYQAR